MTEPRPQEPRAQATLCPYCGHVSGSPSGCRVCGGRFDPLSRQATQNTMGPWFVRDEKNPHLPGCSYETLRKLVLRGKVGRASIIRGPTTRQFWVIAPRVPGVAHLLGECHNCRARTEPAASSCAQCGASFEPDTERQRLGLGPVHLLPGQATPEQIAAQSTLVEAHEDVEEVYESPVEDVDQASPARSEVIDEIVEARAPKRGRAGKVVLGLVVLGACGAMAWFGYGRFAPARAPVPVEQVEAGVDPTPEATSPEVVVQAPEPTIEAAPEGNVVLDLLRQGRVEAARDQLAADATTDGPAMEAIERRAERDRIRSVLPG